MLVEGNLDQAVIGAADRQLLPRGGPDADALLGERGGAENDGKGHRGLRP